MPDKTQPKKILVTGGLGFIGSNFVELALERGYHVTNIDKITYAARNDLEFEQDPNYVFIREDITELKKLPENISAIINFAAESHVDNSIASNKSFLKSNVGGVHNLLELLRAIPKDKRPLLVHISTDEVYGDKMEGSFKETDTLKPSNPYSATKAAADQLVLGWSRTYDIRSRIIRSCNNYGYGQQAEKLIPKTIKLASKDTRMTVHGNGQYLREWICVKDNCEAILKVLESGKDGETYNVSTGEMYSNLDVIKMIHSLMGKPNDFYDFLEDPRSGGQDIRYSVDSAKIRTLGWSSKTSLEEYLPKYLELCKTGSSKILQGFKGTMKKYFTKMRPIEKK